MLDRVSGLLDECQANKHPGGLVVIAGVIHPPTPAAVGVLHAVEYLEAGLDHRIDAGFHVGPTDPERLIGAADDGIGQRPAHGLFDAAVGIAGQVFKTTQDGAGIRVAELQRHLAGRRVDLRHRQGNQDVSAEIAGLGLHVRDCRRLHRLGHLDRIRKAVAGHCRDGHLSIGICLNRHRPAHRYGLARVDLDGLGGLPLDRQSLSGQADLYAEGSVTVIMEDGGQIGLIAGGQDARQGGIHNQWLGHQNIGRSLTHFAVQCDRPGGQPPGGQVVG